MIAYDVVIPSSGRESLRPLLEVLCRQQGPRRGRVIVVDDRKHRPKPLPVGSAVTVVPAPARGPAAARNAGWRAGRADWVVFLDDDVVPTETWAAALADDLRAAGPEVAAVQGRIEVPLVADRPPTDWERNVAGLEHARWATGDMACRRLALHAIGGFDERFRRAYREDSDLGLRLTEAGFKIKPGSRRVLHPVRPADRWVSIRLQAGNADDALMRALHGPDWRARAGAPRGRLTRHLAVTAAGASALAASALGKRRTASLALSGWLAGTAELAWARIAPGPRTRDEICLMAWTSALMPAVASAYAAAGRMTAPRRARQPGPQPTPAPQPTRAAQRGQPPSLQAVLLDRDGTLIEDVPYCNDPALVRPLRGVRAGLERLRERGLKLAVVSNQSGIARGLVSERQLTAVNSRVEQLLGPVGPWFVCPHGPDDDCRCRKPRPGLIEQAAARLGVAPKNCAVIGDIGSDMEAALAAGARPLLVPTPCTRPQEILAAPEVATSFAEAVEKLLGAPAPTARERDEAVA